jgi:predicted lipoprotein with Yx(FWY)xxD motif
MPPGRLRRTCLTGAAALAAALALAACGGPVTQLTETPTTNQSLTLTLEKSPVGLILATGTGATLYDFPPDSRTHSACLNDGCVFQWPPLVKAGPVTVGPGVQKSLISTLERPDGSTQLSYDGHPLYTYNLDVKPGMITGQAIDQDGGPWYVLLANGHEVHTAFTVNG